MDGERISLRLEKEDLELIDEFIRAHPEVSNRSQLARLAIRSFIEGSTHSRQGAEQDLVTVDLPRAARRSIEAWVMAGVYKSVADAIERCVSDKFISEEFRQKVEKRIVDTMTDVVEVVPE